MRKTAFFIGLVVGACGGLLSSLSDGLGLKLIMMSFGAIAGAAIGGAIARIGNRGRLPLDEPVESYGLGTSPEDRVKNFWRDKGKLVPFSGPPDPHGTPHDFDRERL